MKVCERCNGHGKVTCPDCRGDGKDLVDVTYDLFHQFKECYRCSGSGEILCQDCNGSGEVD